MISVLTITYKRHHLLEEAIESFLRQANGYEMVVINDNPDVKYMFDHPNVKIINHPTRFPSIAAKLEWGYKQCSNNYIYRLDDDDLLAENALDIVSKEIVLHPEYEIYRSKGHYFFINNNFDKIAGSVNNGNVYSKSYLNRIKFPDKSGDEDADITFGHNAKIHTIDDPTMIYRWGMNTLHISGMGKQSNEAILNKADKVLDGTKGIIQLSPKFKQDYYKKIKKPH